MGTAPVGERFDRPAGALQHHCHCDHHKEHAGEAVESAQPRSESLFEIVCGGEVAHAAEDDGGDPVEGGDEKPDPLVPDPGQADFVGGADGGHGLIGVGAGAEVVHQHHPAPEFPAAHKEVAGGAHFSGRPQPEGGDSHQVEEEGYKVYAV